MPSAEPRVMRRFGTALVLTFAGCAGTVGTAGLPMPSVAFRPEDHVVLGDFSRVNAIAASLDRAYIAYPTALGIWRPLEHRWEVPRTPPNIALMSTVFAGLIDPTDQSLWLASRGGWLHYNADIDRWDQGSFPSQVQAMVINPAAAERGVYFRTAAGWLLQPRMGGVAIAQAPPPALRPPPTIDDAMRDLPALRVYAARILAGPHLEPGTFTAAAPSVDGRGWFLGTSNRGAVYVDRVAAIPEPLSLGLTGDQVGALAVTDGGIWAATNRFAGKTAGLTQIASDLSQSTAMFGMAATGYPFGVVARILPDGDRLWLATDQGVVHLSPPDGDMETWTEARGIPGRSALALAKIGDRMAVGTMRGLVEIGKNGIVTRRDGAFQEPVYALLAHGDTLWVGSAFGLFAILPNDSLLQRPNGLRGVLTARTPVLGLGYFADTLVAMTSEQLVWRDPVSGNWTAGPLLTAELGPLVAFFVDGSGIWVAGERGVGVTRPTRILQHVAGVPNDLPGRVTSIVTQSNWLWVGTTAGLVRIRLSGR